MLRRKKGSGKADEAIATIRTNTSDEEMRMQVEERLRGANPSWGQDSLSLSVPMDAEFGQILSQVSGMFPGETITLQTSHGDYNIQSIGSDDVASHASRKLTNEAYDSMDPLDPHGSL